MEFLSVPDASLASGTYSSNFVAPGSAIEHTMSYNSTPSGHVVQSIQPRDGASSYPAPIASQGTDTAGTAPLAFIPHHAPFSFSSDNDRKTRVIQSCTECRRRKIKCDRVFPCGMCQLRKEEHLCTEYIKERQSSPTGYTLVADFLLLAERVQQIERYLQLITDNTSSMNGNRIDATRSLTAAGLLVPDIGQSYAEAWPAAGTFSKTSVHQEDGNQPIDASYPAEEAKYNSKDVGTMLTLLQGSRSGTPDDPHQEAALVLEDMVLNRSQTQRRAAIQQSAGPTSSRFLPSPTYGHLISVAALVSGRRGRDTVTIPVVAAFRGLVDIFLRRVLWTLRCIHVPSFMHELEGFLSRPMQVEGDIFTEVQQIPFLGCLFAALATGIYFASEDECLSLGFTVGSRRSLAWQWYDASMHILYCSDWLQKHRVQSLQAVLILGPFLNAVGRSETHWALTGSAIKVAQSLGLSKLVAEDRVRAETRGKIFGKGFETLLAREVGRRIWINLVELDWLFAAEHNNSWSIQPSQSLSAEPAAVLDDDLIGKEGLVLLPVEKWSDMSYLLWRCKLMYPYREMLESRNAHGHSTGSAIQAAHAQIMQIYANLPLFYQLQTDLRGFAVDETQLNQLTLERISINSAIHTRLLRLHRGGLSKPSKSANYADSSNICINSAHSLLDLADMYSRDDITASRWWPVEYGIFSATVVLFLAFCRSEGNDLVESSGVERGILKLQQLGSRDAEKSPAMATTLEKLLAEARLQKSRNYSGVPAKRKIDDLEAPHAPGLDGFVQSVFLGSNSRGDGASSSLQESLSGSVDWEQMLSQMEEDPFRDIFSMTTLDSEQDYFASNLESLWNYPTT